MLNKPSLAKNKYSSPWYSGAGVIYFIAAGSPPVAIKIGVAKRDGVVRRLRGIQSSNHELIELLGILPFEEGDKPLLQAERREQELHKQFAHLQRIVDGNVGHEWFTAAPELLSFIKTTAVLPEKFCFPRCVSLKKEINR